MFWKGEMPFFLISKYVGSSIHGKRGASLGILAQARREKQSSKGQNKIYGPLTRRQRLDAVCIDYSDEGAANIGSGLLGSVEKKLYSKSERRIFL